MMKRNPTTIEKIKCLGDFVTDGCSLSPDMVFSDCCITHDVDYYTGIVSRAQADKNLRECIKRHGFPVLCWVYWIGVRIFGWISYYFGKPYNYRLEYKKHIEKRNLEKTIRNEE